MIDLKYLAAQRIPNDALPQVNPSSAMNKGLTIFFVTLGSISFLIMVIAGLKYVLSAGDPDKITKARNTIIYAGVGLIVAASASLIVTLVLDRTK